ncbi:hypothetical protein B296_00047563 [Ensete ventricosum]|uniref:Uncharacterized protein n=1 Tax=Ensete ventricosum TaxID=4639 RepID=A0A426XE15_ENSVE|nr:hypothetical protein B296_00047563 [Ensete ventricosum]
MMSVGELYAVVDESVPLGLARVRKLVHVDQEEVRKLKRGPLGLERAFRDAFVQSLPCGPARRPSRLGSSWDLGAIVDY